MTLGQMLAWHRGLCVRRTDPGRCTATRACSEYLEIAGEYTEARRIYAGPVAPSTVLSVREAVT